MLDHQPKQDVRTTLQTLSYLMGKKNRQKTVWRSACVFVNSALKIQCHVVKITLRTTDCFFGDFAHWDRFWSRNNVQTTL